MDSEADRRHSSPGFPHSDIPGSRPACGSPRLIAASYVLRRLLMPGHSPYTLSSLTILFAPDTHGLSTRPIQLSKNDADDDRHQRNCLEDVEQIIRSANGTHENHSRLNAQPDYPFAQHS